MDILGQDEVNVETKDLTEDGGRSKMQMTITGYITVDRRVADF